MPIKILVTASRKSISSGISWRINALFTFPDRNSMEGYQGIMWMWVAVQRVLLEKWLNRPWVVGGCIVNVHDKFPLPCTPPNREKLLNRRDHVSIDEP
jgi:hypothetical protein